MSPMSHGGMGTWGRGHAVSFYALDKEGVDAVARYVAHGWDRDECVVCVCSPALRERVEASLAGMGRDPRAEQERGRYHPRDPERSIAAFVRDGRFDPTAFRALVRSLVDEAAAGGRHVRAFSETISLLWERGLVDAAIELELHWGQEMRDHDFQLVCAYPTGMYDHAELVDVRRITELHTELVPPEQVPADDQAYAVLGKTHACSRVYDPIPESVPAARHFVLDVLRSWGHEMLTTDAALVVSELATNALSHAVTPFRAVVYRRGGGLRIGVEDATDAPLEPRERSPEAVSGRGVAIVAALSDQWGFDRVAGGKVVWADLAFPNGTLNGHAPNGAAPD
jgi:anti-sigma regulatory factor (Ser/Thr protein kinase)